MLNNLFSTKQKLLLPSTFRNAKKGSNKIYNVVIKEIMSGVKSSWVLRIGNTVKIPPPGIVITVNFINTK